jgi:hypothetical protein
VYEKRVGGTTEQEQPLSGWIELVRK